ncbi:hypothetical protein FRC01_002847 [Tulasnella sp. 417]|nr:hypothetical protein FRC01_002847 [Tulasnella sp. 417]
MPLLWTNLDAADPIANTEIRIRRSQTARLTLNMWIPPHFGKQEGKAKLSRFIQMVEPERHRVQRLVIEPFSRMWMLHSLHFLRQDGFDSLETLQLGSAEEDPQHRGVKGAILPAQLRELGFKRVFADCTGSSLQANIARLILAEVTVSLPKLQSTFLAMPGLEALVLDVVRVEDRWVPSAEPVVLAQLRYLVVRNSKVALISSIIETPSLFSLQLDNPVFNRPFDPENAETIVLPTLTRQNGQLRRLHLVGCLMPADAWTESFYNLPDLEYLRIKGCEIEASHLAGLRGLGTGTAGMENYHRVQLSACQRLEELVFENEVAIDSGTVRDIVELRSTNLDTGGFGGIKWVTFRGCDSDLIKDEDVQAMAQLTKGIACDLLDGKEAWAEDSDKSSESAGSADSWDSSDEGFESSSEED